MHSQTLPKIARIALKQLISQCTEPQISMFKRMYSKQEDADIYLVIDEMQDDKLDHALFQCEQTIIKNKQHVY